MNFFTSDAWPFYRYNANRRRNLDLFVKGVEPAAKKSMPLSAKIAFQRAVGEHLRKLRRGPFRGGVALRLAFETTAKNPPLIHTIAKNFLDLLGRSQPDRRAQNDSPLYRDDSQVHALSVSCRHGADTPSIRITAQQHRAFVQNLGIASYVSRNLDGERSSSTEDRFGNAVERVLELRADENEFCDTAGDNAFQRLLAIRQRDAQEALFTRTRIDLHLLALLHGSPAPTGLPGDIIQPPPTGEFETILREFPLRVSLPSLPRKSGDSQEYERAVEQALQSLRNSYSMILDPLRIPTALEVLVKPPRDASPATALDLDNIVRNYLFKPLSRELQPLSSYQFSFGETTQSATGAPTRRPEKRTPPNPTRIGVPRYEVWRLPRADGDASEGWVCLNFVYGFAGFGDTFARLEKTVAEAQEAMWQRQ